MSVDITHWTQSIDHIFQIEARKIGAHEGRNVYLYRASMRTSTGMDFWGYGLSPEKAIIAYCLISGVEDGELLEQHLYAEQVKYEVAR